MICLRGATWRLYPCVLWTGKPNSAGYGVEYVKGSGARHPKYIGVHVRALQQKLGRPLRPGYQACHHCDVKLCIQPEHLYEGTQIDNMRDAAERGRLGHPNGYPSGPAHPRARFTADQVRAIRALGEQRVPFTEIGRRYGTSGRHVSLIFRRQRYGEVV